MRTEFFFPSNGAGEIHAVRWMPEGNPSAIIQIVHGIAEYADRYASFAEYLNRLGYMVVAEDHMGHGKSVGSAGIRGYFHGGWFAAVDDSHSLMKMVHSEYPDLPYILLGHSMGSFMVRTILCRYPDSGISAAVIVGTGWQPKQMLSAAIGLCEAVCKINGEDQPSSMLQNLVFGGYNKKVEHPRTAYDWLTRDRKIVDAYINDPYCCFVPTAGLLRDMLTGMRYIEGKDSLASMRRDLPVLFVSGGDDPVGSYGKGVLRAADAFRKSGMQQVSCKLYPLGRHEILNEINRQEVYQHITAWLAEKQAK